MPEKVPAIALLAASGSLQAEFRGGCVIAAWWVGADRNRVAEEFAIRLQRETGCQIIDREHGRMVERCNWKDAAGLDGAKTSSGQARGDSRTPNPRRG
jgi:hypothetical protein